MADEADRAQSVTEHFTELAIAKIRKPRPNAESAKRCIHCSGAIPEKRRKILPGIQTCVCCASAALH